MTKRYKLIIFDLGNTIIRFDHHIASRKIASAYGKDETVLYEALFDSELTRSFDRGDLSPHGFHSKLMARLGIEMPFDEFACVWSDIFWEDEDACRLVRRLKPGNKLCLLSNVNKLHFEFIKKKFDIIKIFDHVIVSYLVGAMKPDRKIFEHAAKVGGAQFSEILYIDDREDLVKEATALGIESHRFEGAAALESWLLKKKVL
jgi:putative hydrolase of the HAD superfamily